mgnify:CR=1 FL=1
MKKLLLAACALTVLGACTPTPSVGTGFRDVDEMLGGLHPSDLIVLAGRPSMGKTALATNIAYNAAANYKVVKNANGEDEVESGAVVGFFSLEMSADQLAARILGGRRGLADLAPNDGPQLTGRVVKVLGRQAIEATRAISPRLHPRIIGQRLELATDARLGHLENRAQLRHGELVLFEQHQQAASDRIGQGRHVFENRDH